MTLHELLDSMTEAELRGDVRYASIESYFAPMTDAALDELRRECEAEEGLPDEYLDAVEGEISARHYLRRER